MRGCVCGCVLGCFKSAVHIHSSTPLRFVHSLRRSIPTATRPLFFLVMFGLSSGYAVVEGGGGEGGGRNPLDDLHPESHIYSKNIKGDT